MADPRTFVLIGEFRDEISKHLVAINKNLAKVKNNLESVSKATKPLKDDFKDLADLSNKFSSSLKGQASDIRDMTAAMKAMRSEMGRINRAYRAAGRNRSIVPPPPPPPRTPRTTLPPPPPPPRTPRSYQYPAGGGRGGYSPPPRPSQRGGRESVLGEVISGNLISNAIIQGFQAGVGILQQGMSAAFGAFAERTKDQLDDIGAAGGIFSAGQFSNIPGFPKTFQGAMELQDKINKDMATIASSLPGTTHDYVQNSRRLVDTTAQIMARDMQGFTKLATDLSGKINISAEEAFRVVNVEVAKATTMLEKLNPAQTVIPMTQLVEDMLKDEKVTIGGLRRYVSFRRSTTFEAALQRNIDELNKTGAGTADRLKMIVKVLKQAAPPEMVVAFQSSVAGVVEGFRSAFLDPDVGIFGLSRTLSLEVKKFDRESGKYIGTEFTNFFKMFSEVFGNIGNLINSAILPGLQALYEPFKAIAEQFVKLREFSYEVFRRQQEYTAYFDSLADKFGMRREDFKVFEKGGVSVLMDILQGFNMLSDAKYKKLLGKMKQGGTPQQVAKNMKEVYSDIIPAIFESPFFKNIGTTLGKALAEVFKEIAKIMKALLEGDYGVSQFTQAFYDGGGMDAINEILMYVAEGFGKLLMGIAQAYMGALTKAIGSGNFAAAGVLGALGLVFGAPAIAGIKIIASGMKLLVNAFKMLLAKKVVPTNVKDLGSVITDPRRMLPGTAVAPVPGGALAPATSGAGGIAGFGSMIARILPALGKLSAILTAVVLLGGGVENTLRQLQQALGEMGHSIGGSFSGLFDVLGTLTGFVGDLGSGIGRLFNFLTGTETQLDLIKILLTPITAGLQALEIGLLGLNVLLAKVRSWMSNWLGTEEEKKRNRQEALQAELKMREAQGRQNAYNASMLGEQNLRKQISAATYELQNSRELKAPRSAELRAFIQEARAQLGQKTGKTGEPAPTKEEAETASQTTEINKKSSQQIKEATAIRSSTDKTTQAVRELSTKITPQTNLQTSVAAIYSLLASGQLRVVSSLGATPPGFPLPGNPDNLRVLPPAPTNPNQWQLGNPFARAKGGLGDAIASELKNKPSGSDLVIANSSETVIPAAGGYGMKEFMGTLTSGFTAVKTQLEALGLGVSISNKESKERDQKTNKKITDYHNQTQQQILKLNQNLSSLSTQVGSMGSTGGMAGGAGGGLFGAGGGGSAKVIAVGKMLQGMGLNVAENPAFGTGRVGQHAPGSYHYSGRAIDVTGSDAQLDAAYAKLKAMGGYAELLWRTAGHYDHLHVAYALGAGNPAFFGSQSAAERWERSMVPGSVRVGSVTGNSAEGFGGGTTVTNNITINQQPGQDADELASIVALKIGEAVADARAASIFV